MSQVKRFQAGLDFCAVSDIRACINGAADAGYFFICAPIFHQRYNREFISGEAKFREEPLTRADIVTYNMAEWTNWVVGKISEGLNVDSEDPIIQMQSEEALNQELMQASHLGLSAIQIQLHGLQHNDLARIIYSKIVSTGDSIGCGYQIWVHIPMQNPSVINSSLIEDDGSEVKHENTWSWWDKFRTLCNSEDKLGLALEMTADLPSQEEIARWAGEPIRCLVISTTLFLRNKKGYPVLSKAHQSVYKELIRNLNMQIVIKGAVRHEQVKFYQQYLEFLSKAVDDPVSEYARGYEDFLQCPLQPLMDNLESSTYEVFERDPVKYRLYKEAIYQALRDRIPEEEKDTTVFVVMIVGAGRGPLVRATMVAADKASRKVKIYAVDKNPGAIITLKSQQVEIWGDLVTVVSTDMREWNPPEKADILVSELLGSFGDNELSPECLDGAQKFLKEGGISIPSSYTSYVCPIQSARLWAETRKGRLIDKFHLHYLETAYVVHQQNKYNIAPIQPLFTFHHPNTDAVPSNKRRKILSFKVEQDSILHGVSGFFDAVLYGDILLSIHPDTHSENMCSWFPIFFPIHTPIPVKKGDELELIFWRCVNSKRVWYEWCFTKPVVTEIHNPVGRSYSIGL